MKTTLCIIFFLILNDAQAYELFGHVVNIRDGDTITLLSADNQTHKIRLEGIDAPELDQLFGKASKKHLGELLKKHAENFHTDCTKKDKYQRDLCTLWGGASAVNINQLMVKDGYAWAFVKYSQQYVQNEEVARFSKVGLWTDPNPIQPWEWRKSMKAKK